MKFLIVQLLRLGDILLSAPVAAALRKKFPKAELHFLAFKGFEQAEELFPPGIRWHWIDREELQAAIKNPDQSFFYAADLLENSLQALKEVRFDHVFNLTQTRLSGWICSQLNAVQKTGLSFDANAQAQFGSPWFKYLNDHVAVGSGEVFHYADLFRFACELEEFDAVCNLPHARRNAAAPAVHSDSAAHIRCKEDLPPAPLAKDGRTFPVRPSGSRDWGSRIFK